MEFSLRSQLNKISINTINFNYRKFKVAPVSLRKAMEAMESPRPEQWSKKNEKEFSNEDWTDENQGVTTDYRYWYMSSNKNGKMRVYRLGLDNKIKERVKLAGSGSAHLGDIDYYKGFIYCAMQGKNQIVLINAKTFNSYSVHPIRAQNGISNVSGDILPWCAINPWNELLYTSDFGNEDGPGINRMLAFERVGNMFRYKPDADIILKTRVKRIQGGCFTKNGHLLLASDHSLDIKCFSVLNGKYLGRSKIRASKGFPEYEEVEGLCVWENITYKGHKTHVHVVLLDNDSPSGDDIFFKHYQVPLSQHL